MSSMESARAEVRGFMEAQETEPDHVLHVCSLSMQLFDGLAPALGMDGPERFLLESGSLLHDIGWTNNPDGKAHHRLSEERILAHPWQTLAASQVLMISQIARYHRKALPSDDDARFMSLAVGERKTVEALAAMLRIADALDSSHRKTVHAVAARFEPDALVLELRVCRDAARELAKVEAKGDLARRTFGKSRIITVPTV